MYQAGCCRDRRYGSAYYNRGSLHALKGNADKAAADFARANDDPRFVEEVGVQAGLSIKFEEEKINQRIAANPRDAEAYRRRAELRMVKSDPDGGIADAAKAIELEPRDAVSYNIRGYLLMSKEDLDGAIADFNKAIEIDSKLEAPYANRGMALLAKGKDAEAQRDFDRCFELAPVLKPALEAQIKAIKERRAKNNR